MSTVNFEKWHCPLSLFPVNLKIVLCRLLIIAYHVMPVIFILILTRFKSPVNFRERPFGSVEFGSGLQQLTCNITNINMRKTMF